MSFNRREFLEKSALTSASLLAFDAWLAHGQESANNRMVVGVMGVNGRGSALASAFAALPNCTVGYVCDVDKRAVEKASKLVADKTGQAPQGVSDFRRILDDKAVDALVIAAPDHWHAPATILACSAKKHVYVEKPCSHNAREGEVMVEAARRHGRTVQHGTQRRSMAAVREAIELVHSGKIGPVRFGRAWYNNTRPSIGVGKTAEVPEWLDYALWQGPAPERPYKDNLIHYNWHWLWNWGTGELGNNGIHGLDVVRWGMQVNFPQRVTAGGGRYHYQDDQETPDTHVVTYDFGDKCITWEGRSCLRRGFEGSQFGIAFYGEGGSVVIDGANYVLYDEKGKELAKSAGSSKFAGADTLHAANFLDCCKTGAAPNADIQEGYKSTLLCHLGNIAYRSGRTVNCDPQTGRILNDEGQQQLWSREYRPGWEPKVS